MCVLGERFFVLLGSLYHSVSLQQKRTKKKKNQKTKNDKLGDGKKFGHELINDETKNIYKKTKLFKGSGVMVIRSEVI